MKKFRGFSEYGPLILFFATNFAFGIMPATAVLVASTLVAVALAIRLEGRVPWLPVVGAVLVSVFGGLTLVFDDAFFLKIKPTVASLLFAAGLAGGLAFRRNLLKTALGSILTLDERGWRTLTLYWIAVFCVLAAANEIAWRNLSTDGWVTFKTFGLTGLSILAGIATVPLMKPRTRRVREGE